MRGNDQQAYDRGTSLFSPDGRIYQVEYAREAVSRGAPSVGVRTGEGVILSARTRVGSSLMEAESVEKLHKLDDHAAAASAGHVADARRLIDHARQQAQVNRLRYGEPIGIETLTTSITDEIQENTQMGGTRPFGAALLVGGIERGEPHLFETDPSGTAHEWKAGVIGGNREQIQSVLEDEWTDDLDLDAGLRLALRALSEAEEDLTAEGVSVATVTEDDGFTLFETEDIDGILAEIDGSGDGD